MGLEPQKSNKNMRVKVSPGRECIERVWKWAMSRETNSWKWPLFQLVYMTVLAYGAAFVAYQGLRAWGF